VIDLSSERLKRLLKATTANREIHVEGVDLPREYPELMFLARPLAEIVLELRERIEVLENECEAAGQRVEALEDALRPFAEAIKGNYSNQPDSAWLMCGLNGSDLRLTLGLADFRRAKELLEGK